MGDREKAVRLVPTVVFAFGIGYALSSPIWGIITLLIASFFAIWTGQGWQWLFANSSQSTVELTDELKILLNKLQQIGFYKNRLPSRYRDWCNSLGLYVQYEETNTRARLKVGRNEGTDLDATIDYSYGIFDRGVRKYDPDEYIRYGVMGTLTRIKMRYDKYHADINDTVDYPSQLFDWEVEKYNPGSWESLVDPTYDIVVWLDAHGWLDEKQALALNAAIERYREDSKLELPYI